METLFAESRDLFPQEVTKLPVFCFYDYRHWMGNFSTDTIDYCESHFVR